MATNFFFFFFTWPSSSFFLLSLPPLRVLFLLLFLLFLLAPLTFACRLPRLSLRRFYNKQTNYRTTATRPSRGRPGTLRFRLSPAEKAYSCSPRPPGKSRDRQGGWGGGGKGPGRKAGRSETSAISAGSSPGRRCHFFAVLTRPPLVRWSSSFSRLSFSSLIASLPFCLLLS